MKEKIIIAGGTGFIGNYLRERFTALGFDVQIISRQPGHVDWANTNAIITALEHAAVLINLTGKSVDCRYNEQNKEEIFNSRINTTIALGDAILKCKNPPKLWINSSTATIYRHAEDRPMTETTGEIGSGFSVDIATSWEKAFFSFKLKQTRQVALRMAIVLGKTGGVLKPLKRLVQFGLGGKQGTGRQMFSWIHVEDIFEIIFFLHTHTALEGVFNVSAPGPVNNYTLMKSLRNHMHVKFGAPAPAWLLTIGAVIIRTETELILKSRWVVPEKLLACGYKFKFEQLDPALEDILQGH